MDLRDDVKVDPKPQEDDKGKDKKGQNERGGIAGDPGPISPDDLLGWYDR